MEAINTQALRVLRLFGIQVQSVLWQLLAPSKNISLLIKISLIRELTYFSVEEHFLAPVPLGTGNGWPLLWRYKAKSCRLYERAWWALEARYSGKNQTQRSSTCTAWASSIFTTTNIATDHNQLTMEIMKNVARNYDLVCLLHEKPFAGVNGSGKHNNWALSTDGGKNLLNPGKNPQGERTVPTFPLLLVGCRQISGFAKISSASAGNDHRLGSSEAPPTSYFYIHGDELTGILECYWKRKSLWGPR